MSFSPSPNGGNGARDARGRFAVGNPGGPGNPYAKQVGRIRSLILEAVTEDDLRAIVAGLVERAKAGDMAAARELLDRLVGRPATAIDADQIELEKERFKLRKKQIKVMEDRLWMADRRYEDVQGPPPDRTTAAGLRLHHRVRRRLRP